MSELHAHREVGGGGVKGDVGVVDDGAAKVIGLVDLVVSR